MSEVVFTNGMIFKLPNEKAPNYVRGSISIKPVEFIQWMRENIEKGSEWINIDLKIGKSGKPYACLNDWKPNQVPQSHNNEPHRRSDTSQGNNQGYPKPDKFEDDSDIPF